MFVHSVHISIGIAKRKHSVFFIAVGSMFIIMTSFICLAIFHFEFIVLLIRPPLSVHSSCNSTFFRSHLIASSASPLFFFLRHKFYLSFALRNFTPLIDFVAFVSCLLPFSSFFFSSLSCCIFIEKANERL